MNQSIDISIAKLSAPVEMLDLNRRAGRALRHASIYTVAEILLTGKARLGTVKLIGAMTATYIFEAVSGYLGLPVDLLTEEAAPEPGAVHEVGEDPIRVLPVPAKTLCALENVGYSRIDQLVKVRANGYEKLRWLRSQDIDEIDQALKHYLARTAQLRLVRLTGVDVAFEAFCPQPTPISSPALRLPLPKLSDEHWAVLSCRAMHPDLSLAETGAQNDGTSAKTVRRILRHAHRQVRLNLSNLRRFLDYFEQKSTGFEKKLGQGPLDLQPLVVHLMPDPVDSDLILDSQDVERTIFLLRTLVQHPNSWFETQMQPRWPVLLRLSCLVEPVLAPQEPLPEKLPEKAPAPRRKRYQELAYAVLARTGEPMHWSAIAEEACHMGGRDSFVTSSLQGSLTFRRDLFVHMGGGTYALAEWGCQAPGSFAEIIASVMQQEKRPLPHNLIFARVCERRPVRQSSLKMALILYPRFYRSIQGTYGLRSWLPAGDQKDLSTPNWLIEDPVSLRRVERARARGYNVDRMVARDREACMPPERMSGGEPSGLTIQDCG